MRNGPFAVSLALHGAVVIAALILAARARRGEPPPEDLVWIEMAAPPAATPDRPSPPRKPAEPPRADSQTRAPPAAAKMVAVRTSPGAVRSGGAAPGGGLGVLAGEGAGDGFEMSPEPGNGGGSGPVAAPPPEPPPPPPPPKPAPPKPKEPSCEEALVKPKPIAKPRSIEYPDAARADGKEGRLLLELTVGEDGSVARVDVLSSVHPALDAAAIAAVKTWRFEPASRCGKPASATYRVARRFELGD